MEAQLVPNEVKEDEIRKIRIKVIGVGGGGSNSVSRMHSEGIKDVEFLICNTDQQALQSSRVPDKLSLGSNLTRGLGAGCDPEKGRNAALESAEEIKKSIGPNIEMVFITAGMGGGTGTGAAPVVAKIAKDMGKLTVAVVTYPFSYEGPETLARAYEGTMEISKYVDSILIIENDKISTIYGDLSVSEGFKKADDIVTIAVRSIAEIITGEGYINVDMADVKMVMQNSGVALIGSGIGEGPERAVQAVQNAFDSPLISDFDLNTARNLLVNITSHKEDELTGAEMGIIMNTISEYTGHDIEKFKRGFAYSSKLPEGAVSVAIIATGYKMSLLPPTRKKPQIIPGTEIPIDMPEGGEEGCDEILLTLPQVEENEETLLREIRREDFSIYTKETNISDYENEPALVRLKRNREQNNR